MERKITFHHPIIVLWFGFQHIGYRSPLVFSEIEHFYAVFHHKSPGEIDDRLLTDMFEDSIDIIAQLGISDNLRHQYIPGGCRVRFRTVSAFELFIAIKTIGST